MTAGTAFIGHVLPGSFFILFSTWWIFCIFLRYRKCLVVQRQFRASASYQLSSSVTNKLVTSDSNAVTKVCCCFFYLLHVLPVEGIVKILAATIGSLGELATGYDYNMQRYRPSGVHHVSMYLFFGLSGITDLLTYSKVYFAPEGLDYCEFRVFFSLTIKFYE